MAATTEQRSILDRVDLVMHDTHAAVACWGCLGVDVYEPGAHISDVQRRVRHHRDRQPYERERSGRARCGEPGDSREL
ncbi:MAG: hypothetical protein ACLPVY_04145 [Acidimicrobiia bacterium]